MPVASRGGDLTGNDVTELDDRAPRKRSLVRQTNQRLVQLRIIIFQLMRFAGHGDQVGAQINVVVEFVGAANAKNR